MQPDHTKEQSRWVYFTQQPKEPEAGDTQKVVIYIPPEEGEVIELAVGEIFFQGWDQKLTIVDPTGVEWDHAQSPLRVLEAVQAFLNSDREFLQLTSPRNGEPMYLRRDLCERLWFVNSAVAKVNKQHLARRVPSGLAVVQGLPPGFAARLPG